MDQTRLLSWFGLGEKEEVDWDRVYATELPRVYNFFRYRVLDRATAEDLTSTTFEKAWRARGRYRRDRAHVETWLLAIARNVAIDHFRSRARTEVPLELALGDHRDTPEESAVRRDELKRLGCLLQGLEERERELLALKYGAGATNRAIAKVTGLTESNVGTILFRTISRLRVQWEEGGEP